MQFDLYLESGPQHRKTWVFIPGLPGCTVRGLTTDAALEAVPAAILERLDFLRLHGENAPDPVFWSCARAWGAAAKDPRRPASPLQV